jgi:hypothetical protein
MKKVIKIEFTNGKQLAEVLTNMISRSENFMELINQLYVIIDILESKSKE